MFLFKKNRKINFLHKPFIFCIIIAWIFSGWPQIFNFPPKIQEVRADTLSLYVNSLDVAAWTTVGASPYLDVQDQPTNYIHSVGRNTNSGNYGFTDTAVTGTINSVVLYVYAYGAAPTNFTTFLSGTPTGLGPPTNWGWVNVDVSTILTTWDVINAATVYFDRPNTKNNAGVDTAYLYVDYTPSSGTLTTDIVDAAGDPVASPSIAMSAANFSFDHQTASGTFGVSAEKIRVENTTAAPAWTLAIAADSGTTAFWDGAASDYDFNDPTANAEDGADTDSLGGQMTINASIGTLGGTCSATDITKGSSASFSEGSTDSITLLTAGASADTSCYWDLTGVSISQTVPAEQPADNYSINITLTVTAS